MGASSAVTTLSLFMSAAITIRSTRYTLLHDLIDPTNRAVGSGVMRLSESLIADLSIAGDAVAETIATSYCMTLPLPAGSCAYTVTSYRFPERFKSPKAQAGAETERHLSDHEKC
jgi:hypothetical protein